MNRCPSTLKLNSALIRSGLTAPVEIEMRFVPGLPGILFLGLPDVSLKETAIRLRSAIRSAGFEIPRGKQLLVDISPRDEKKTAHGLDLAVCVGFLILSGQIARSEWERVMLFGDIRLGGEVIAPDDWRKAQLLAEAGFVTGPLGPGVGEEYAAYINQKTSRVVSISSIEELKTFRLDAAVRSCEGPLLEDRREGVFEDPSESSTLGAWSQELRFTNEVSRLAALMALGGHPTLLAGPPGTGKSTLARVVHAIRPKPAVALSREILLWRTDDQPETKWGERPLLEPHHTTSQLAMVGGGRPVRAGVVTRAHGGTLLMDEVLLFRPEVQESLREPLETGMVKLARGTEWKGFPADFQLIGTTNLCACGKYTPDQPESCHCSSRLRSRFEDRLRGPFVDRFQILSFTDRWRSEKAQVSLVEIHERVRAGRKFQMEKRGQLENRHWRPTDEEVRGVGSDSGGFSRLIAKNLASMTSERRRLAVFRVARTLADLDGAEAVREADFLEASRLAFESFQALYSGRGAP